MTLAERIYVAMIEAELALGVDDKRVVQLGSERAIALAALAFNAEAVFRRVQNELDRAAGPLPEPGGKPRPPPTSVPGPGVRRG